MSRVLQHNGMAFVGVATSRRRSSARNARLRAITMCYDAKSLVSPVVCLPYVVGALQRQFIHRIGKADGVVAWRELCPDFHAASQPGQELLPGVEVKIDGNARAAVFKLKQGTVAGTLDQPGVHSWTLKGVCRPSSSTNRARRERPRMRTKDSCRHGRAPEFSTPAPGFRRRSAAPKHQVPDAVPQAQAALLELGERPVFGAR